MKSNTYQTGFTRVAVAALAVLLAPAMAPAQSDSDDAETARAGRPLVIFNRGRTEGYNFILRAPEGRGVVLLGGDSSEPVVVNMDGPGLLITCGQTSSGGASIAYEFVAADPRTTDGPDPRTEAAVRRLSEEFARGEPNYDLMTPCMAGTARAQLESLQERFTSLGPIETVRLDEDWSAQGADTFDVEYANGSLRWVIALTSDGRAKMWMFHDMR